MGLIRHFGLTSKFGLLLLSVLTLLSVFHYDVTAITLDGTDRSYARYPKWNACVNASISFEFKTTQDEGLLMYTDDGGKYDFFEVKKIIMIPLFASNFLFLVVHEIYFIYFSKFGDFFSSFEIIFHSLFSYFAFRKTHLCLF